MNQYHLYTLIIVLVGVIGIFGIVTKYKIEAGLQQCVITNGAGVNIVWQRECEP